MIGCHLHGPCPVGHAHWHCEPHLKNCASGSPRRKTASEVCHARPHPNYLRAYHKTQRISGTLPLPTAPSKHETSPAALGIFTGFFSTVSRPFQTLPRLLHTPYCSRLESHLNTCFEGFLHQSTWWRAAMTTRCQTWERTGMQRGRGHWSRSNHGSVRFQGSARVKACGQRASGATHMQNSIRPLPRFYMLSSSDLQCLRNDRHRPAVKRPSAQLCRSSP